MIRDAFSFEERMVSKQRSVGQRSPCNLQLRLDVGLAFWTSLLIAYTIAVTHGQDYLQLRPTMLQARQQR